MAVSVSEEIRDPYSVILPELLICSFHKDEVMYLKADDEAFALPYMVFLDEYISVMLVEFIMNAMDEFGIILKIDPNTRDKLNELYVKHGMCDERMLDLIDDAVHLWVDEAKKKAGRDDISQTYVINEFMKAASFYTSTSDIIIKIYKFIQNYMNDIVDDSAPIDEFESEYSDIIGLADMNELIDLQNKSLTQYPRIILELITFLVKEGKHIKMTFEEFEEVLKNVNSTK